MSSSPVVIKIPKTPRSPSREKRKAGMLRTSGDEKNLYQMKRSAAMIEEQVILIKDTQDVIERILKDIEQSSRSGFDKREEELQTLLNKSQELLVMLQVMMKIRNELAYARIDLEKAIKADHGIEIAKKRVKWLQQRLERLLSTTKSYCAVNLSVQSKYLQKGDISEKMWNFLSDDQRERYFNKKDHYNGYRQDTAGLMDDFSKMVLATDTNDLLVSENFAEKVEQQRDKEQEDKSSTLQKTVIDQSKKKKKKKKRRDITDEISKGGYSVTVPEGDLYDGDGDSSPEPISETEGDDDTRSSIASSVGAEEVGTRTRPVTQSQQPVRTLTVESIADNQPVEEDGKIQEYWDSDHHKFEWCDYMLKLDPRSWHALGIAVQDSFISREKHQFDSNIPWKEKPMKVNSVIDVHKIALDKLLLRLHRIYEAIGQATQATIDPIPRNETMETVMGKREDVASTLEAKVAISRATTDATGSVSRDGVLPPLPEVPTNRVTMISMSPELKQSNRKSTKYFPRQAKEWCEDIKSGHDMPRLVTFKPPPILKKMSNVQSRYLGRKSDNQDKKPAFSLFRKDEWKPAVIKRLVGAMRAFDSSSPQGDRTTIAVEEGTPRWRRLMELLGESGLKSPNQTIAMEAAKTIGQLNCTHPNVLAALSDTISDLSKPPRVLYEASKALILLGNWSQQAMKVIIEHIKKGNELVVKELLDTMTKAKNIPFVDQSTPEFQSLVYLLIELVKVDYHPLSYRAAIGLGKLCVVEPVSKGFLVDHLATLTAEEKSEALLVLIKQMNCKDKYVLEVLLDHLCTAHNSKNRLQAAELLIFIGARDLFSVLSTEEVFDVLVRLLWDHSNKELRAKIGEVINVLGIRQPACSIVLRRLEDPNEEVRAQSVISLATLGMKGGRELKALLDILELDSSVYVRIQVIRAFSQLKWNDPRIIRSLRERDRGDSILASEARKAVAKLTEEERPSNTRPTNTIDV